MIECFTKQFTPLYALSISSQINSILKDTKIKVVQMVWVPNFTDSVGKSYPAHMMVAFEKDLS
jgi:hypothetical protein